MWQGQPPGGSSAIAADVAALATNLRTMTDAEIETHILPVYEGVETPVIDTPTRWPSPSA